MPRILLAPLDTRGAPVDSLVLLLVAPVLVLVALTVSGCGHAQPAGIGATAESPTLTSATSLVGAPAATPATTATGPTTLTLPAPPTTVGSGPVPWAPPSQEVVAAFQALETRLPGVRLYVPERLPAGTTVAPGWWPVSLGKSPTVWTGPTAANPQVTGEPDDPQVSIVLRVGDGDAWLEVLERFKGDLGDLPSRPVPDVAGRPAASYRLHGGDLIQWSDGGSWFGVYGRHLAAGVTAEVAASMRPTKD